MKLVLIEWQDPAYTGAHWENREPFIERPVNCITCGILLHEDKDTVHIVLSLNPEYYAQGMAMSKRWIKRMRTLRI